MEKAPASKGTLLVEENGHKRVAPEDADGPGGQTLLTYVRPDLLPPRIARHKYPHRYTNIHEPQQEDHLGRPCAYELNGSRFLVRVFLSILDWSAFGVMMLSCAATIVCMNQKWYTDMPLTLLAAGIIFPVSFGITYSAGRRERVLMDIASLKASIVALYQLYRDWEATFPQPKRRYTVESRALMTTLVEDMDVYIRHQGGKERLHRIYQGFDEISKIHEALRKEGDWVKSVLSRCYQYQRYMMTDFERLRVIHDFRTAGSLRSYAFMFLYFFPLMLAPLFANYGHLYGTWAGIFLCVEDPFDEFGIDDINFGILSEALRHLL